VHHQTLKQINQPDASVSQIYCSSFKPEAATAVYKLLMMGMRMPETC